MTVGTVYTFRYLVLSTGYLRLRVFPPFYLNYLIIRMVGGLSGIGSFFVGFILPEGRGGEFRERVRHAGFWVAILKACREGGSGVTMGYSVYN